MNLSSTIERNSRLGLAQAKNKSEQSKMCMEIQKLEREKRTEIRLWRNEKKKFKSKYSRNHNLQLLYPYKITESRSIISDRSRFQGGDRSSKAVMHEENFKQIHKLLFSNGEIDIDKVLCLHLLSAHRAETLTPVRKKLAYVCKMHSPVERLLERSKKKYIARYDNRFVSILPLYSIELMEFDSEKEKKCPLINDGRLATRILLNVLFRELIDAVLSALNQSNSEKKEEIIDAINDIERLRDIFKKKKILDFVADLLHYPTLKSWESYVLSPPFRIRTIQLEIVTKDGDLEELVKQIRRNVLQIPRVPLGAAQREVKRKQVQNQPKKYSNIIISRRNMSRLDSRSDVETTKGSFRSSTSSGTSRKISDESEKRIGKHEYKNFIQKNIEDAAKAKKIEYDTDEEDEMFHKRPSKERKAYRRRSSESSDFFGNSSKSPLAQAIHARITEEEEEITSKTDKVRSRELNTSSRDSRSIQTSRSKRGSSDRNSITSNRLYIKQTTCPACAMKWKQPLPTPKTPRVDKNKVIPLMPDENPFLRTNAQNRINSLIHKEMFKLETYDRRYSTGSASSRRSLLRKKEIEPSGSDFWNLNPMDKAKIEQEVREKETQLKLQNFLKG